MDVHYSNEWILIWKFDEWQIIAEELYIRIRIFITSNTQILKIAKGVRLIWFWMLIKICICRYQDVIFLRGHVVSQSCCRN